MPNSEELKIAFTVDDEAEVKQAAVMESVERRLSALDKAMDDERRKDFDRLAQKIHPTNVEKGFWDEPTMMDKYAAKLALIHSEVTEVLEALRKGKGPDEVTEEFSDILIRTFDLYGELVEVGEASPELYGIMTDKMEKNKSRPPKHGNRWG